VLAANQQVATLLLTNHLWVRVYVPGPWLGHIQLGERVSVRVDSDPDLEFSGAVETDRPGCRVHTPQRANGGERIKQVFGVKIRLDNPGGKLRAGMAADITFAGVPK